MCSVAPSSRSAPVGCSTGIITAPDLMTQRKTWERETRHGGGRRRGGAGSEGAEPTDAPSILHGGLIPDLDYWLCFSRKLTKGASCDLQS
ncbi:hypothetical protein Q7C36_017708 [Tachysurus vachellii]|uniref:Uncharacterized protein n=1 Tax=Tachysurus vachellii TaxID=175792 RepID=A0AA88S818_TACVA|nr:hypothetical protein Q7C36_017708 [Tachysurus vachellii]